MDFPEPTQRQDDSRVVLLQYLDFFRGTLREKLLGLDDSSLRTSILPSGWTPIELAKHLVHMERRWIVWGYEGQAIVDPWADRRNDRWFVAPNEQLVELLAQLDACSRHTRQLVMSRSLEDIGAESARWQGEPPPPLQRVLLHLIQEYARHIGHLDIVRELLDGTIGE